MVAAVSMVISTAVVVTAHTPAAGAADQPAASLSAALGKLRQVVPASVPRVSVSGASPTSTTVVHGSAAAPPVTAHAGATFAPTGQPATSLLTLITLASILQILGALIDALTYRVCAESATMALKCSPRTLLGSSVAVDDTGDGRADVTATLQPLLTGAGTSKVRFTVRTIPLIGHTAAAHVFAVFSVPGANRQFAIGFDGQSSRLGTSNQLTFLLKSTARALTGDIDTSLTVAYTSPGAVSAITLCAAKVAGGQLVDPAEALLQFAPTPASFTGDVRIQNNATPAYTVTVQSPLASTFTTRAVTFQTAAGAETAIDARIDKLPRSVTLAAKNGGSTLSADYAGSAPIDTLDVDVWTLPNLADISTYTLMGAGLTHVPVNAHIVATKPHDLVLSTTSPIGVSSVFLSSLQSGFLSSDILGYFSAVPTTVHLHGDVTSGAADEVTTLTYEAGAREQFVALYLYDHLAAQTFLEATVTAADMPKYLQASVAKHAHDSAASLDARSGAGGPAGSASVGQLTLNYSTTGAQLSDADLPTTDNVVIHETATDVQVALRCTGLSYAQFALHDDVTASDADTASIELRNAAPRTVTIIGDTPALTLNSLINAVQSETTLTYAKQSTETDLDYHASAATSSAMAAVTEKVGTAASIGMSVTGVPSDIHVDVDAANATANWLASGPATNAALSGQVTAAGRSWVANANMTAVPSTVQLRLGPSDYSVLAGTVPSTDVVGSLSASVTNHATAQTESGDHLITNYNAGSGDLDATVTMSQVRSFDYTPGSNGFSVDSRMAGGQPFHLLTNLLLADGASSAQHLDQISTNATVSPLPASMTLSQAGTQLDYTSVANADLDVTIAIGRSDAVAVTPTSPVVRGVSARDGRACDLSGCADALRIHAFLQGAPTALHADLSTADYNITQYAPPAAHNEFDADVALDSDPDATKQFTALITLGGITPAGQNMEIGPLTTAAGPVANSETTTVAYHGNHAAGPLTASIVTSTRTAYVTASNLPMTTSVTATTRPDGMAFTGNSTDQITSLTAFYKPTGAANWALTASLDQLPQAFDYSELALGDQPASSDPCAPAPVRPPVPTISYTADADTLDLTAGVDRGQLFGALTGSITAGITNLGRAAHATWDDKTLHMTSVPQTDSLEVHVPDAIVGIHDDFDPSAANPCSPASDSDFVSYDVSGHLYVTAHIHDAGMSATNVSVLDVTPSFSTAVQGTFATFGMAWAGMSVDIDAEVHVTVTIDFGGGISVSPTLADLHHVVSTVAHVNFGTYQQTLDVFLTIPTPVPCGIAPPAIYEVHTGITPQRVGTGHGGYSVPGPTAATGNAWVITMDPGGLIADNDLNVVTGVFTSPLAHGLDASFDCTDI